jgi:hypothetical protein
MPEHWTPEDIRNYERAIKLAPKQRAQIAANKKRKLDRLFDRLHGDRSNAGGQVHEV